MQLQEACFGDVVLLYRPAEAAAAAAGGTPPGQAKEGGEGLPGVEESVGGTSDQASQRLDRLSKRAGTLAQAGLGGCVQPARACPSLITVCSLHDAQLRPQS